MGATVRERLLTSAIELVRERGVAGTGITELIAHSDVARRSVYINFPGGKAELVEEATKVAGSGLGAVIASITALDDPAASLEKFVDTWKKVLVGSDFNSGCPIVAAALARADAPAASAAAGAAFGDWIELISAQLRRAGVAAQDARSLATMAVSAIEGAVVLAVATRSVQPLDDVARHLGDLVRMYCGR